MSKDSNSPAPTIIKIVVLGSSNVGKSSLIERFITGNFTGKRTVTIGADFASKRVTLQDSTIIVQIWDTAGMERFSHNNLSASFYRNSDGVILVYDINNLASFEQLKLWRDEVDNKIDQKGYANFPVVVVANKIDLIQERNIVFESSVDMKEGEFNNREDFNTDIPFRIVENIQHLSNKKSSNEILDEDTSVSDEVEHDDITSYKNSIDHESQFNNEKIKLWCANNSFGHIEASAKDGTGVEAAVVTIAALALEARQQLFEERPSLREKNRKPKNNIDLGELYAPKQQSSCKECLI